MIPVRKLLIPAYLVYQAQINRTIGEGRVMIIVKMGLWRVGISVLSVGISVRLVREMWIIVRAVFRMGIFRICWGVSVWSSVLGIII